MFYYYINDHLGSSSIITDRTGNIVNHYGYKAFGDERYTDAPGFDISNRFTGQILDRETGLYYYGARYYDPVIGRFVQADTIIPGDPTANSQLLNRYTYALNNPLRFTDPTGNKSEDAVKNEQKLIQETDNAVGATIAGAGNSGSSAVTAATTKNGGSGIGGNDLRDGSAGHSWKDYQSGKDKAIEVTYKTFGAIVDGTYHVLRIGNNVLDVGFDVAGIFDPTPYCDIVGAGRYGVRGDAFSAGVGLTAAAVPYAGDLAKLAKYGDKAADLVSRGVKNPQVRAAIERGQKAHAEFIAKAKAKGWKANEAIDGTRLRPDAIDPKGRPIELKPNTPSGRMQGAKQLNGYKEALDRKGRVIYYDPKDYQ